MTSALRTDAATAEPQDGLPIPRRYWSVLTIWLGMTLAVLDGAIANVALPTIARELHTTEAASIWIVNAYQLAIVISLLPVAALGDRLGYRRVYAFGVAIFTIGSLACALSNSLPALVAARVLQGFGAAGIMGINAALVRLTYPRRLLGHGIGLNAVVISIGAAIGPSIASAILGVASWQWLFAVNVPVGILCLMWAPWALPRTKGTKAPLDVISVALNALAFGLIILGLDGLVRGDLNTGTPEFVAGVIAAVLLTRRELKITAPLVPLDLLRIPIFGLSIATSVASFSAMTLAFLALPFYFQGAMGRSAVATGLLMTPWMILTAVIAPIAGKLSDRYPAGALGGFGLGVFAVGLFALSRIHPGASDLDIGWRMALCGFGFGFFQSPNNRAMVSSAPLKRAGAAGGMLATARLSGQTIGAVVMAMFFHLAGAHATTSALATAAVMAGAACLVSLSRLKWAARPKGLYDEVKPGAKKAAS